MSAAEDQSEALFREHRECLERYAISLVGGGADADDLIQDTFLKAHRHLSEGGKIHEPLNFLFVTMRNLVNDAHRRTRDVEAAPDMDEFALPDKPPSLERQVMSEREFEQLCIAITQLPERMRYAFILRKVYGYRCQEIAEQLGRSTNTVRAQVAQSFRKLKALLDAQGETRPGSRRRRAHRQENDGVRRINTTPCPSSESS